MNDMKRLIEKYKQELMEYNRAAARSTPIQKLEFPEMVTEPSEELSPAAVSSEADFPTAQTAPAETVTELPPASEEPLPAAEPAPQQEPPYEDFNFVYTPDVFGGEEESDTAALDNTESVSFVGGAPESGEDISEQLAKRPFEPDKMPVNSPEDIRPLVQSGEPSEPYVEPVYEDIDAFYDANTRRGQLQFTVYTARRALPVPNARVVVYKTIGGRDHAFYTYITDMSGQTPEMRLPAPSSTLSQSPSNTVQPFSLYDAFISAPGFNDVLIRDIPVFEGITSMQRVAMVPSAGSPQLGSESPDFTEVQNARE